MSVPTHPNGAKCSDCRHFVRTCKWLLSYSGEETQCDWTPSRFFAKREALPKPRVCSCESDYHLPTCDRVLG